MMLRVFIGFDPRERDAYLVAAHSLRKHASIPVHIEPLVLEHLRWKRLYNRPTSNKAPAGAPPRLWDEISGAPMSTEFALTRFLVPHLCGYRGWALFCDCDFLFRGDVALLLEEQDPRYAVRVVQHRQEAAEGVKMDGQVQTAYERKNWSSFVLWNCEHEAHAGTLERVNRWRGLSLHQFRWIQDAEIGELVKSWNWLEGTSQLELFGRPWSPLAVHFTRGVPSMSGYENVAFADEWRQALAEATHAAAGVEYLREDRSAERLHLAARDARHA
jgi:hypothetical protein